MQLGPTMDPVTPLIEALGMMYPVMLVVALIMMLVAVLTREWQKAVISLLMLGTSGFVVHILPIFLGVTAPAAAPVFDPLATIERHIGSILLALLVSVSSAGFLLLGRYLYRKRQQRLQLHRNRQAESTIRFEYSEWLEEEALKLEIEVLSAPGDRKIQALLERVRETGTNNLRYLQAQHEEPVLRDAIQKEWNQLRQELNTEVSLFPAVTSADEADFRKTLKGF